MGRILEALSQAERTDAPAIESVPAPPTDAAEPAFACTEPEAGPLSFIEVGGGEQKFFDASPDVLACAVPRKPAAAALAAASRAVEPAPSVRTEAGLRSVTYRPLPPGRMPLPPARERFARELVAFHQPTGALSECCRALLASLQADWNGVDSPVVLFTAPASGIGTTTVLLNLAITAARAPGARVLVVDANSHRPAVARQLGLPAVPGLREVLEGAIAPADGLHETGLEGLRALTAGCPETEGRKRLVVEAMPVVLRPLREQFSLVLIDAPAWGAGPEAAILAAACDAVYLVTPQAQAEAPAVLEVLQAMRQQCLPVRGCILTQG